MSTTLIGKPTVKSTTAFDIYTLTQNPYIINFVWNGQKCYGNRLTVNGMNHDITGLSSTYHTLTKQVCDQLNIKNGNTYTATITMLDSDGNAASNPSDQFFIYCYSTPTFSIRNIYNNSTIKTTEFMALLEYSSKDGMELQSYKFNLCDNTGTILLDSSNELYMLVDENTTDYSNCSYTFKGLENNNSYIIEAIGLTVYGMELKCTYQINVKSTSSTIQSLVTTEATKDGNINVNISCIPMKYESSGSLSYIDNEEIDLREKNEYVKYTLVKPLNNFKFKGKLRGIKNLSKSVLSFSDSTGTDNNIISIIPDVHYIHATTEQSDDTTNLIRPEEFIYNGAEYIDYIESAYMTLNLYVNDTLYVANGTNVQLLYDSLKDEFYLDESREFIIEIIKIDGNYGLTVTEITNEEG